MELSNEENEESNFKEEEVIIRKYTGIKEFKFEEEEKEELIIRKYTEIKQINSKKSVRNDNLFLYKSRNIMLKILCMYV